MAPTLAFDIETVPDLEGLRRLHDFDDNVSDHDVAEFAFQRRRASSGSDFLQLHLQRVVAIACALREGDTFRVWSLGTPADGEAEIIRRFFDGIEKYTPQLVSWNGSGFDLPVLHYRSMALGLSAARYWDMGDDDRDFRFNNYINRYHTRHLDLMDLLALYQPRAYVGLDDLARLCGFPGKLGMDGSMVGEAFRAGRIEEIRNYCETDVVNTYLVFLRFQLLRGVLDASGYSRECEVVRSTLAGSREPHWHAFLDAWKPL
ncbi:MAG: 3'-5' exonuclease [Betaproteobacteria bacterium RIFCSPLOWO2_02_FULL_63_19]|nr:MAG: 3'-5' exonuclease [Betaproteobacteria bacterium RIFCSPLOWO2_02_FULL_63_19]